MVDFDPLMGAEMARAEELGLFDSRERLIDRVAQVLADDYFGGPISELDIEEACMECGIDPELFSDDEIEWLTECVEDL